MSFFLSYLRCSLSFFQLLFCVPQVWHFSSRISGVLMSIPKLPPFIHRYLSLSSALMVDEIGLQFMKKFFEFFPCRWRRRNVPQTRHWTFNSQCPRLASSPCWIDWMPYLRINTRNCPSYTKLPMPVVMASPRREKDVTKIDARQSCAQHDSIFSFTLQRPWVFL